MPEQKLPRQVSANEKIRRRIRDWQDYDPSVLLTTQIEKAAAPLQGLVAVMLPERLVHEAVQKTLRMAQTLTDRSDVIKSFGVESLSEIAACKVGQCDKHAENVQSWAVGAATSLGAWDVTGPLGTETSLISLLALVFRTIKQIGLCYGFDTSLHCEEMIALETLAAASTLSGRDKAVALKAIGKITTTYCVHPAESTRSVVEQSIRKISRQIGLNLTRRRALAGIPALESFVGGSTNAWLIQDVGWAARNIYATRLFERKHEVRVAGQQRRLAERVIGAAQTADETELPAVAASPLPKAA